MISFIVGVDYKSMVRFLQKKVSTYTPKNTPQVLSMALKSKTEGFMKCSTCRIEMKDEQAFLRHLRSVWHTQKLLEAKDQPGQTLKEDEQIQCDSSSAAKVAKSGDGRHGAKVGGEQTQGGGGGVVVKQVSLVIIEKTMEGKKCTSNVWNIAADNTPTTSPSTPSNKKKQIYKDVSDTSNEVNMRQESKEATGYQNIGQNKQIDRKRCEPMKDLCPDDIRQKQFSNAAYCRICEVGCNNELGLKEHLKGHKHKMKLLKNIKNIPATSPINFKEFVACPDRESRLKPNLSVKPGSEKKLLLLGLAYITEFQQRNCSELPQYVCNLCECVCDVHSVITHITGTKHRIKYIMYKQKILFVLGDQLPMNYDAAISIFSVCRTPESEKMKHCITSYVNALIDIWTKAFGEGHVKDRENITKKVKQVVNHYKTHVYNEKNRTKPKKKGTPFVKKTIRILNQEWRQMSMTVTKNRKPILIPINDTLNCGKDMDSLTGIEKDFYMDQTGARLGRISESIDVEYVNEKEAELVAKTAALEREEEYALEEVSEGEKIEEEYALEEVSDGEKIEEEYASEEVTDGNYDMNSSDAQLDVSLNRSGHVRSTSQLVVVQHESTGARPKIRQTRNCTNKIKSTCTEVSLKCNISNQASRVAVQTVCSGLYGHDYYLTKEEAIEKDPSLEELRSESTAPKPPKRSKSKETVAHTAKQWKAYENVLPSTKSLNNHKQVLAIQHEKEAATALYMIQPGTKVTLHFDTTSRSKIDGDWPCLILIFSDKRRYPLRPIFFAYEDRPQIVRLIVETYNRLAATIDTDEHPISAKMLWEKTTALMTDSVSKNLKIGEGVAENLQSLHVPIHLLCKSHPVEAFDRSNLSVLASVEKKLEFREKLQTMNPAVKSFLRGKTSIVEAAITSILSLVCHDKSAHSTNQADLFDYILQREGQVKHIAMYYERRFTKLGYSAASILQSLPYLRMVLNESHLSNQHIEIVRMFLDSEFLITELQVLAYFTHVVTLPFLYFVEVNSQEELLEMFPHLFNDLKCSAVDTLKEYRVEYPHIQVTQPTTDIAQQLLKKMCEDAATVLDRQAGREYGFGEGVDVTPRATQLHLLSPEERAGLPTNNLDAERHLSVFGKRAPVAKFRNKKFTAKGIRNDVTLFQSKTFKNEQSKGFTSIVRLLNDMEKDWVDEQKQFLQLKIQEKIEKGKNQSRYTQKCLQQCKGWNGPATSVEELHTILNLNPDNREKIVRTELSFYRDTHKADVIQQPDLFKINNISHEEQLLNLCALLGEHDPGRDYVSLPSNKDAATVLSNSTDSTPDYTEDTVAVGKYYLTLITEGKVNTWYVASCEGKNSDGTYEMDHLTRVQRGSNLKWRHPNYHYPEYSIEVHILTVNANRSTVSQAVTKIADVIQKKEGDQCIDVRVKIEPEATISDKDKQSKIIAELVQTLNSFETGHKSCHSGKEDSMPSEISDQTKQPDGEKDLPSFYQLMRPVANILNRMPIMTEQEMLLGQEIFQTIITALQNKISDGENAAMTNREISGSTSQ